MHELICKCDFPSSVQDEMLHDRFVLGLHDNEVWCKLSMEETLDIKKAVDVARQSELVKQQMNNAVSGAGGHVHEAGATRSRC